MLKYSLSSYAQNATLKFKIEHQVLQKLTKQKTKDNTTP